MILDYTSFSFASQLPVQWIKFAYEVTPADIRKRFRTTYILTPNTLAVKSLRRTYNLTSGSCCLLLLFDKLNSLAVRNGYIFEHGRLFDS